MPKNKLKEGLRGPSVFRDNRGAKCNVCSAGLFGYTSSALALLFPLSSWTRLSFDVVFVTLVMILSWLVGW